VSLPADNFQAAGSTLTVGPIGTLNAQGQQFSIAAAENAATITVPSLPQGLTLIISGGTFSGGTVMNVASGNLVKIIGGAYIGDMTFNVAPGAIAITASSAATPSDTRLTGADAARGWNGLKGAGVTNGAPLAGGRQSLSANIDTGVRKSRENHPAAQRADMTASPLLRGTWKLCTCEPAAK
jgi:hypothetical protein